MIGYGGTLQVLQIIIIFNIISVVKVFILTFRNIYPITGKNWLILLVYQEGQTFPKVSTPRMTSPTIYPYMCQLKGRRRGAIRKNKLQHFFREKCSDETTNNPNALRNITTLTTLIIYKVIKRNILSCVCIYIIKIQRIQKV